ncbi:hypothetical protein JTE90_020376 [Oedothorax gibbosus]|uniref:SWIM-type domain-containing protein n=1 Tax=Oedothorax gibbosus TaxID=931172 RepID=A0AAV6TRH1_9ARAC|nr:hypothetical protein JTE90_020376 [Oedothorax gibbosus]
MIVAQVEAGQTLKKYYEPWAVLDGTGKILSSHCTCMAGLGEACSHIAAILFAIETTIKLGINKPSCTSVPCKWKAVMPKAVLETSAFHAMIEDFEETDTDESTL